MRNPIVVIALACTLLQTACADQSPSQRPSGPDSGVDAAFTPPPDASRSQADVALEPVDAAPPEPGWLELTVSPRRSLYSLTDSIRADVTLFSVYGEAISATQIRYEATPEGIIDVASDGTITPIGVGAVSLRACSDGQCDEANLLLDDGPPRLTVDTPAQAAVFSGPDEQIIVVSGRVEDLTPGLRLTVNGVVTDVGENGAFYTVLDADLGTTLIEVRADDGVSPSPAFVIRDVMWAPLFIQPEGNQVAIADVASFRMDQALFDGDAAPEVPVGAAELDLDNLAQLLEMIFALIDLEGLLNAEDLFGDGGAGFTIDRVDLGQPTIDFLITETGLELFVRFGDVRIFTAGELDLQGQSVDLTGHIDLSVVARIDVAMGLADRVTVEVGESAVAVESIEAEFAAEGLGALINVASAGITDLIQDAFTGVVDDALRTQVSEFLRTALLGIFGDLSSVPLQIDPMLPGVMPIDLELSLVIGDIQYTQRNWIRFVLDLVISHAQEPAGQDNDPGVIQLVPTPWSDLSGDGIGISLRMSLFNALLHEVWRAGTLNLELELPPELAGLIDRVIVNAMLSPVIVPADAAANRPLEMQIGAMMVGVVRPGGSEVDTYALSIRSGMAVEFGGNAFQLLLDDVPQIRSQLVDAQSEMPLPAALIEGALRGLVWDQLTEALTGGFDLGFSSIDIDPTSLAEFAPRINALEAIPTFADALEYRDSQLRLEGNLGMQLGLSAAPQDNPPVNPGEAPPGRGR